MTDKPRQRPPGSELSRAAGLRASLEKTLPPRAAGARVRVLADVAAVPAPSVAPPAAVVAADVDAAWATLREGLAPRRARATGEKIGAGDDVDVDVVAFADGKPVPFAGRALRGVPLATADTLAPQLSRALVGAVVGGHGTLDTRLPPDPPHHAGGPVVVAWAVLGAVERGAPLADTEVAQRSKLGRDRAEVRRALERTLTQQREAEHRLARALAHVDAIAAASALEGVDAAARTEVHAAAMALEGDLWLQAGGTPADIEALVARWLVEPGVLDEATRRAARALTLRALAERHGIQVDAAMRKGALASAAGIAGLDALALQAELRAQGEDAARLDELLLPFAVLDWLMAR